MRILLILTLAVSTLFVTPEPTEACINGMRERVDPNVRAISKAERDSRRGQHAAAIKKVMRAWPNLSTNNLKTRARRVLATATVRTQGKLARDKAATPNQNKAQRAANLNWAVKQLEGQLRTKRDDPAIKLLLAEGLAQLPGKQDRALKILNELDDAGLIVEAQGYATLARLKREAGDDQGSAKAIKLCQQMAHDATLCTGFLAEGNKG